MLKKNNKNNPFVIGEPPLCRGFISRRAGEWTEEAFLAVDENGPDKEFLTTGISKKRINIFLALILAFIGLLFMRSFYLQIILGKNFFTLAESNRIRIKNIVPERGVFFDRNGEQLSLNIPDFSLAIIPADLPREENERHGVIAKISKLVDISEEKIIKKLENIPAFSYQPVIVKENIGEEDAILLNIACAKLSGVEVETGYKRSYLFPEESLKTLSHVLGYEGKITKEELEAGDDYLITDRVGKFGLEYSYERELRGTRGRKEMEVDSRGREDKVLTEIPAVPGNNLILTIDAEFQAESEKILQKYLTQYKKNRGMVIALNPQNGEILSFVNLPTFSSNDFVSGINAEKYNELLNNPDRPLFTRAIKGEYPSGSTFKPIVGAAALEEGIISKNTSFLSVGGLRIAGLWWFPDWKVGGHGITNIIKALAESVNTFFYIVGGGYNDFTGLGVFKITEYAKKFGLGSRLGIDIPGESTGFLPSEEWKEKTKGEEWYIGDTYHYAIGQGDILVTPLQVVSWMSVFGNGGILYKPHFVKEIQDNDGEVVKTSEPEILNQNFISKNNIETVREGLRSAVLYGSSRRLLDLPVTSAGKTGTAEWGEGKKPHAWFTAFAPYVNPEIAIVVLVEEGEEGSGIALSAANEILYWYFTNRYAGI